MRKKLERLFAAAALSLALAGCTTSPGGIAPSTIPITSNDTYTIVNHDVVGVDSSYSILFIPVTSSCDAYKALQNAKNNNGADALINVTAENKNVYLFIVNWQKVKIHGDAIKFQRAGETIN